MKTIQTMTERISRSISLKLVITGFLMLIMLIPAGMIKQLISERQSTRDMVVAEISDKWGRAQTITGPIMAIPYVSFNTVGNDLVKVPKTLYVLPETLDIKGQLDPEIRYRSTYKVIVYESDINFSGRFILPEIGNFDIDAECIEWDKARLVFGISDMRGIQQEIKTRWNEDTLTADPGIIFPAFAQSGFSSNVILHPGTTEYFFSMDLFLNGSENLYFTPVGKTTNAAITSPWATPSFSGSFLPDERAISEKGFDANWTVLHLNRNFPQIWNNQTFNVNDSSFGVNLLFAVDEYQKSMRSAKYAIMFIALTYLIFLLVEAILKKRFHPVQYILVSAALLLFYTLLLSLSEHIGFIPAYFVSSMAIIGLITAYVHKAFKIKKITAIVCISLMVLYTFLFVILQMDDYSLLFGSVGLFLILGFVMYLSKKINWYGLTDGEANPDKPLM